jgi:hypothetical protein
MHGAVFLLPGPRERRSSSSISRGLMRESAQHNHKLRRYDALCAPDRMAVHDSARPADGRRNSGKL